MTENFKVRRVKKDVLQILKDHDCEHRLWYSVKLSAKSEGVIKTFHDKSTLERFMTTKPTLQWIWAKMLCAEEKGVPNMLLE